MLRRLRISFYLFALKVKANKKTLHGRIWARAGTGAWGNCLQHHNLILTGVTTISSINELFLRHIYSEFFFQAHAFSFRHLVMLR
jgi:hypothetical protein